MPRASATSRRPKRTFSSAAYVLLLVGLALRAIGALIRPSLHPGQARREEGVENSQQHPEGEETDRKGERVVVDRRDEDRPEPQPSCQEERPEDEANRSGAD